jgi:hypothetical protein
MAEAERGEQRLDSREWEHARGKEISEAVRLSRWARLCFFFLFVFFFEEFRWGLFVS